MKWAIGAAVVWYCSMAILCIRAKPGFEYDEAIEVRGAVHMRHSREEIKLQHAPDTWTCVGERCFPIMGTRYSGAIKDYLCLPLFAMFGPSAELVRTVAMALGALGIFGIAMFIARQMGFAIAAAVAWVMAIHPSYLDMTVFDNNVFSPWMGALGLMCLALSAYIARRIPRNAFLVGLTIGLGIWARANYLWLLAALGVAIVVCAPKSLLLPIWHLALIAAGAIVGGLPFLVYQALSGGGTWEAMDLLPVSGSFGQRFAYRASLFETLLSDGEHRRIWAGPSLSGWELWLFPMIVALGCVICILARPPAREPAPPVTAGSRGGRAGLPRIVALALLILVGVLFGTRLAIAEHHIVILVPLAAVVVVSAAWGMWSGWARVVVIGVAVVYVVSALHWQFATLAGIRRTGGVGIWSDGITPLTKRLMENFPGREVKILDWGLENGIYVLSDGQIKTREIFWDATADRNPDNEPWMDEIRRGGVFLLNGAQNRQFPEPSKGFLHALDAGRPSAQRIVIPQRSGVPFAEIIEIAPNTLGTAPVVESPSKQLEEISANDPHFAEKSTGFYILEDARWRWTAQEFSLNFPADDRAAKLTVHVTVPEKSFRELGAISMNLEVSGHALAPETFSHAGDYSVARTLQPEWVRDGPIRVQFKLDKTIAPSATDLRRLGIIFVSARLDAR